MSVTMMPIMGPGSEILPLMKKEKDMENDFASSMSTTTSEGRADPQEQQEQQEEPPQPPLKSFAKTLWRTQICKHFQKGTCRYGSKCGFSHSEDVNQRPNLVKTRLCSRFNKGFCKHGDKCQFAHGQPELKVVDMIEDPTSSSKADKPKNKPKKAQKATLKASPLDAEPMKCDLEPMKCPLPGPTRMASTLNVFDDMVPQFIAPSNVPLTKMQQFSCPKFSAPPGLMPSQAEQLRLGQEFSLDSAPRDEPVFHLQMDALRMGLVNNLKDFVGPHASVQPQVNQQVNRNLPPGLFELDSNGYAYAGDYNSNMEGYSNVPFGNIDMAKYNVQPIGEIATQNYNFENVWSDHRVGVGDRF